MKVQVPGIAFDALAESTFATDHADLWQRIQSNKKEATRGRGRTVALNLSAPDFLVVRGRLNKILSDLDSTPYAERGIEGNIVMQSIGVALGRIDDLLRPD